jgi:Na+/H+ antiporter NhaB
MMELLHAGGKLGVCALPYGTLLAMFFAVVAAKAAYVIPVMTGDALTKEVTLSKMLVYLLAWRFAGCLSSVSAWVREVCASQVRHAVSAYHQPV